MVEAIAWRQTGDKPLSDLMMATNKMMDGKFLR